jgi:hypothetical protein
VFPDNGLLVVPAPFDGLRSGDPGLLLVARPGFPLSRE